MEKPSGLLIKMLLLALLLAGCGGGGGGSSSGEANGQGASASSGGSSPTNGQPDSPSVQFATIVVRHQLLSRAVPSDIDQFRCTGLSATGQVVYGPDLRSKTSEFQLSDVPVEVTTLRIEYLQNASELRAQFQRLL